MFDYRSGVTIGEAAKKIGVSPATVRRWWDKEWVNGAKGPGGVVYLDLSSVEKYYGSNKEVINKFSRAYKRGRKDK